MTLRVLHVLDHSIPLHSGYTFRSRAILREQQRLGWETFQLTSPKHAAPSGPEQDVDGLHFYRTLWQPLGLAKLPLVGQIALMRATACRLAEVAAIVRPHLIHAHSPVLNALPALRVGRRLGIPVVYEVRAFWEDAAVDHGTGREGGLRYRATRALESYALRHADHVTTICEGLKAEIIARGVAEERVTVIPNAVDIGEFRFGTPADEQLKRDLGLAGRTVIGFIGSFYAYEGLDLLVQSLPRILEARADARLLLVGGGPQEQALRAAVRQAGLQDKVVFTGRVPHSEVQRYYSVVDVFAYPRHSMRLTELVTPLKPLEAMAQGQLLVASDVGGHRELIRDGQTGMLFKADNVEALADAVLRMLDERSRWPQIRAQGRKFVEDERNWRCSVARYAPVFVRLAAGAPLAQAREAHP
jgi:PEP-CTERM/exosortase A-associated glycosyltransferase